jgi:hypothetical protein
MEAFCFGELLRAEETKISPHPEEKEKNSSRENWQQDSRTGDGRKKEKKKEEKNVPT